MVEDEGQASNIEDVYQPAAANVRRQATDNKEVKRDYWVHILMIIIL